MVRENECNNCFIIHLAFKIYCKIEHLLHCICMHLNFSCKVIKLFKQLTSKKKKKKIGDIKRTFHARTGIIKDRNGKDLTEAEEIKKTWQGYTK